MTIEDTLNKYIELSRKVEEIREKFFKKLMLILLRAARDSCRDISFEVGGFHSSHYKFTPLGRILKRGDVRTFREGWHWHDGKDEFMNEDITKVTTAIKNFEFEYKTKLDELQDALEMINRA